MTAAPVSASEQWRSESAARALGDVRNAEPLVLIGHALWPRSPTAEMGKLTRRLASVAFIACALALALCCLGGAITTASPAFADSLPVPSRPSNVVDLLSNIKLAIQSGALLERKFYGNDNLLLYFSGRSVRLFSDSATLIGGSVLGFDDLVAPTPLNGTFLPGLSLQFSWEKHGGEGVETELILRFGRATKVQFDDVVEVFGSGWKQAPLELPSAHYVPDMVTNTHGNQSIVYEYRSAGFALEMRIAFKGDGTIDSVYSKGRKDG